MMDIIELVQRLRRDLPNMTISILHRSDDPETGVISIHPSNDVYPQIGLRGLSDTFEWIGYWRKAHWSLPIGSLISMPDTNYVIPSHVGEACEPIYVERDDYATLLELTKNWLAEYVGPCDKDFPPIPEGYRLATSQEFQISRLSTDAKLLPYQKQFLDRINAMEERHE